MRRGTRARSEHRLVLATRSTRGQSRSFLAYRIRQIRPPALSGDSSQPSPAPTLISVDRSRTAPTERYQMLSTFLRTAAERSSCSPTAIFAVGPNYLRQITAAMQPSGVGLVTCLYRGLPVAGIWSRLAAAEIDYRFLPAVLVGLTLRARQALLRLNHCTARRDAALGLEDLLRSPINWRTTMPSAPPCGGLVSASPYPRWSSITSVRRHSFRELVRRELRWASTIRLVDPIGFAGSVVTHPLPFAIARRGPWLHGSCFSRRLSCHSSAHTCLWLLGAATIFTYPWRRDGCRSCSLRYAIC